ncbi:MAG: hypothetical protein IPK97_15965 [Ahniella sp.]|nr:hypothetical protein [Ahniella sp.]
MTYQNRGQNTENKQKPVHNQNLNPAPNQSKPQNSGDRQDASKASHHTDTKPAADATKGADLNSGAHAKTEDAAGKKPQPSGAEHTKEIGKDRAQTDSHQNSGDRKQAPGSNPDKVGSDGDEDTSPDTRRASPDAEKNAGNKPAQETSTKR